MKILYVTTVAGTMNFFKSFIDELVKSGHTVELACNAASPVNAFYSELGCKVYNIPFSRNPFDKTNLKAYKKIKELAKNEKYDIIHCHTPVAAMLTRFSFAKSRKNGAKVFYTAHGFHFYKGAPLKNWMIYYPIEKICSYFTDVLITINKEDYDLAKKKMKAKRIEYVAGVGLDTKRFLDYELSAEQKSELRKELCVPENAKLLLSVGELNKNKNHEIILKAISLIGNDDIHYAIAGTGSNAEYLKSLAKELNLEERFHLLGHRRDIEKLYKSSDICCFPSVREGLGMAALEGMACGLPLVAADNRGTRDYCIDEKNGFMCKPFDIYEFASAIKKLINDSDLCKKISQVNIKEIERFEVDNINKEMLKIYFE